MQSVYIASGLIIATLTACGSPSQTAQGMNRVLNAATDYVDPAYELAIVACHTAQREAIAWHEEASAARRQVRTIQARCSEVYAALEVIRAKQTALRAVAFAYEDGSASMVDVLRVSGELMNLYEAAKVLIQAFREDFDPGNIATSEDE